MVGVVDINETVQNVSEAISSVLDVDVIIFDAEFRKVGDTKRHFIREVTEIRDTYVIGHVLRTGETATIASKADSPQCLVCAEQAVCVPIEREGAKVAGTSAGAAGGCGARRRRRSGRRWPSVGRAWRGRRRGCEGAAASDYERWILRIYTATMNEIECDQ